MNKPNPGSGDQDSGRHRRRPSSRRRPPSDRARRPTSGRHRPPSSKTTPRPKQRAPSSKSTPRPRPRKRPNPPETGWHKVRRDGLESRIETQTDSPIYTQTVLLDYSKGDHTPTSSIEIQQPSERQPYAPNSLIGHLLDVPDMPFDLQITEHIATGGMAFVYLAEPHINGQKITSEGLSPLEKRALPPPFVVKVSKDKNDRSNDKLLSGARFLQNLNENGERQPYSPIVFESGVLKSEQLPDRNPTFMVTEYLYPNPIHYLKLGKNPEGEKLIGQGEGLHPQIALLMLNDILEFIHGLNNNDPRLAHGDINLSQILLRMSPLKKGRELNEYATRLDNLHFETVIVDPDTIGELNKKPEKIYFTPCYGDPWIAEDRRYTRKMDAYMAASTFYTLLMGHRLLPEFEVDPQDPNAGIKWIHHVMRYRTPDTDDPERAPLFTPRDVYNAVSKHTAVSMPEPPKPKKTGIFSWFAKEEKPAPLTREQEYTKNIVNLLCSGLCAPDKRAPPAELLKKLKAGFPWKEQKYMLYDVHNREYGWNTREVPIPYGAPDYHKRL